MSGDRKRERSEVLARLWPWLADTTGIRVWTPAEGDHEQSLVWCGHEDGYLKYVVKLHHHPLAAAREREAYRYFAPLLNAGMVSLISTCPQNPSALLFDAAPGQQAPPITPRIMQAAGHWLSALHAIPYTDGDPLCLPDALQKRLAGWVGESRTDSTDLVERVAAALAMCPDVPRVYCHRDFSPRNWFHCVESGAFVVIDFGQTRPDFKLTDFVALAQHWDDPALKSAFFEGYGAPMTEREERVLVGLVALHAMGSMAWAQTHDTERPVEMARAQLAWASQRLSAR